ncbi:MAG: hypothetical protein AAF597_18945 [Bacteroidota bacterium]
MPDIDSQRLALRPVLDLPAATTPEERFQNATLRPIMKQQDALLRAALGIFLTKRKVKLDQIPANQRFAKVKELVTRDNRLRGLLFGIAVGQFTADEMTYYAANEREANRRMTNLLVERLA